jgi:hypothetical protein
MKKLMAICLVCVLLTAAATAVQATPIIVDVIQQPSGPTDAPSLEVCHWMELPTNGGATLSWLVHADEDIWDLHFGSWDDFEMLEAGQTPFSYSFADSTEEELGGPTGGEGLPDPPPEKPYWRTLDLWGSSTGGCPMPYCTYWLIQISAVPRDFDPLPPQNLWLHPTPEPATMVLLGFGALSLVIRKKR